MKKYISWIFDNWYGLLSIGFGIYLMFTKEWKTGGLYLFFCGFFMITRTKINKLEYRIKELEDKMR
jgi:hypothetical protein